jgi:hypothetical protein
MFSGCGNYSNETIGAKDNGVGKTVKLIVKADANSAFVITDDNNNTALKWTDTGLTVSSFGTNTNGINIGLSIVGSWYPFGNTTINSTECLLISCAQSNDTRCNNLPTDTQIVSTENNQGCMLSGGKGIYMLITKSGDPNSNATVANSPSSADGFYTAHLNDFTVDKNGFITVDKMWSCDSSIGTVSCTSVALSELVGGKIYLKVYDGYYGDNSADFDDGTVKYVLINIQTGVVYSGFVSETTNTIIRTIDSAAQAMDQSLVASLKSLAFIIILLYLTITGFMFMTGLSKITQKEAVIKLLKISIVLMFLTPQNIIGSEFPKIYQWLANISSQIILNNMNTDIPVIDTNTSIGQLENNLNYLTFYDSIINQILSRSVNFKIIALIFTLNFYKVTYMYILMCIIVYVVLQSMLLYITAYLQIAILTVVLPILVPTLLFTTTADLFQSWLKYMANAALMIVVSTTGLGIVLSIMISDFSGLVSYSITKSWWWFPDSTHEVNNVLNLQSFMTTLLKTLMCYAFVELVPKLANALSNTQVGVSAQAFNALSQGIKSFGGTLGSGLKYVNNRYLIGRVWDQRYKTGGKYDRSKEGTKFLDSYSYIPRQQIKSVVQKVQQAYKKNAITRVLMDGIIRPMYTSDEHLETLHKEYNMNAWAEYKNATNDNFDKIIESKQADYKKAISENLNQIEDVKIGDKEYKLDTTNEKIDHNGNKFTHEEIRKAIANGEQLKLPDGTKATVSAEGYSQNLRDQYKNLKTSEDQLHKITHEFEKIKRGKV